jgi:FMN phosphatase YigB (HAD superfamily)
MATNNGLVFLFDVDNTLLDNDRVIDHLQQYLTEQVGQERQQRYWEFFEQLREELGYADYLGALQRYRIEYPQDPGLVERVKQWGQAVVLSDGDVVFQPLKIERSGISETFGSNVLIYIHKEQELDDVEKRYPAAHYVLIDDKLRILNAVKKVWGAKVTTVFPRQGHYANDPQALGTYPPPDLSVERIGDLLQYDLESFVPAVRK